MPYQVLAVRSGAVAVTVTWTRSARARSCGVILAMLSSNACRPSAFWAPFLPSARSSAARAFMAARSSVLNPSDIVRTSSPSGPRLGRRRQRYDPRRGESFSNPDRLSAEVVVFTATQPAGMNDRAVLAEVFRLFDVRDDSELEAPDPRATDYRRLGNRSLSVGDVVGVDDRFDA